MKERLTGAIILVALIVLLVPELLTGPPRAASLPTTGLGSSEEPPLKSYTINLAEDARPKAANGSGPLMPQSSGPSMPQVSGTESSGQSSTSTEAPMPAPGSAPVRSAPTPDVSQANDASAPAPNTRPVAPKPAAITGSAQKTRAHQANATASAHSSSPAAARGMSPGSAFAVQLGVFASRQNAEHLAQQMRSKGFKTLVSEHVAASRKLFRVRVGPAADRAAAQQLQERLRASGHGGTIVPYS
ncbi:MAG TPA: SPOR domain-containing protein [Steroidobacteraceae bacterium]